MRTSAQDSYYSIKLNLWRNYFPKLAHKSHFIFVRRWIRKEFYKWTKLDPAVLDERTHIINNSVDKVFEELKYDYSSPKKFDFVTFRGNLDASKYGVDIVNDLAKGNPTLKFLLVGKGEFFKHYNKAENIEWVNSTLSHEQMLEYLNSSKCGLLPIREDTQGVMACEMATFGMPLITSDIEVCHEIFKGFDNVTLIDNNEKNIDLKPILERLISGLPYEKKPIYFARNTTQREVQLFTEILESGNNQKAAPVRVLNVISNLRRGGTEQCVMNYYRHMNRELVQYDFLVLSKEDGIYEDEIQEMGGRVYKIPAFSKNPVSNYLQMHSFFRKHHYSIVEVHAPSPIRYRYCSAAKKYGAKNVIFHAHNNSDRERSDMHYRAASKVRMNTDYRFACSKQSGEYTFCCDDFKVMPNAIELERFVYNPEKRETMRREMSVQDQFVIGHVGRMCDQKNQPFLVDVFAEVCRMQPNAVLMLVGDGELRADLESQVRNLNLEGKVIFTGVRQDVPDLFQAMDVFVLPSRWEGLGIVALEAQAAGLPCVFADTITQEVNVSKNTTYLSLKDSHAKWAEEILRFRGEQRKIDLERLRAGNYYIHEQARSLCSFYETIGSESR